ncbi:MAG: phosphoglycerate dehydrogenase [Bacteroidales bacterium]|nr:phosphoglycerate dehydrogenase [Bacteroidales bacterium]
MNKILVTPRSVTKSGHPSLDLLKQAGYEVVFSKPGEQPTEDELKELLNGCVGYLAGVEKVSAAVLESAKDLKVISRNGVGIDNVDLKIAEKLKIKVCKTDGANARGVSELALSLIFALTRSLPFCDYNLKAGNWERRKGTEIFGKTLGVIGCGRIGRELSILALALNMKVIAYDPFSELFFTPDPGFRFGTLEDIWASADIISLHCPPLPNGQALINAENLAKMKKGVYIVNTARAALVNEPAILAFLDNNKIAGYATDVFPQEPPADRKLAAHPKVIATPHIGGFTDESVNRAMYGAVENILNTLKN